MANPNLLQATSCVANVKSYICTTSEADVLGAVPSDTVRKIVSIYACNIASSPATLDVFIDVYGNNRYLVHEVNVPAYATLVITTKDSPIYLTETSFKLQALASVGSTIHLQVSYEDYS